MAAIRETFEETGLVLGEPDTPTLKTRSPHWRSFCNSMSARGWIACTLSPVPSLLPIAAGATTPGFSWRMPTSSRATCTRRPGLRRTVAPALGVTGRYPYAALPSITRMVLGEVERRLERGHKPEDPGPFIYFRNGKSVIDQI